MKESANAITRFIESHSFQIFAQVLTVAGLLLAAYITSRLAPLSASLADHDFRIRAIEVRNERTDPMIERYLITEQQMKDSIDDIKEIKGGMKTLNEKMDKVIDRL